VRPAADPASELRFRHPDELHSPWAPALADVMRRTGSPAFEEALLPALLDHIRRSGTDLISSRQQDHPPPLDGDHHPPCRWSATTARSATVGGFAWNYDAASLPTRQVWHAVPSGWPGV
jgi:hypothetical protein